jgi:hypothetical protein
MKSLLSISILSVLLSMCDTKPAKESTETETPAATHETVKQKVDAPNVDGATDQHQPGPAPSTEKPARQGAMPDTSVRKIIEHGSPDKARNDSVKAAKTKGKF